MEVRCLLCTGCSGATAKAEDGGGVTTGSAECHIRQSELFDVDALYAMQKTTAEDKAAA